MLEPRLFPVPSANRSNAKSTSRIVPSKSVLKLRTTLLLGPPIWAVTSNPVKAPESPPAKSLIRKVHSNLSPTLTLKLLNSASAPGSCGKTDRGEFPVNEFTIEFVALESNTSLPDRSSERPTREYNVTVWLCGAVVPFTIVSSLYFT